MGGIATRVVGGLRGLVRSGRALLWTNDCAGCCGPGCLYLVRARACSYSPQGEECVFTPADLLICADAKCAGTGDVLNEGQTIRWEGYCYVVDRSKRYCWIGQDECEQPPTTGIQAVLTDVAEFECVPACGQAPCGPVSGWARGERCGPAGPGESGRTPYMCLADLPGCMVIPLSDDEQDGDAARDRCYKFSTDNVYFGDIGPDIWVVPFNKQTDTYCATCCQCNTPEQGFEGRGRCYSYAEAIGSTGDRCMYQPVWVRKPPYTGQQGEPCRNDTQPSSSLYVCCSEIGNVARTAGKIAAYHYVKNNYGSDGSFLSRRTVDLIPGTNLDGPIGVPYAVRAQTDVLIEYAGGGSTHDQGLLECGLRCNASPFVSEGFAGTRACDDPPNDITTASFEFQADPGGAAWTWTATFTRTLRSDGVVTSTEHQRVEFRVMNTAVLAECSGGCGKPPIGQGGGGGVKPPLPGMGRLGVLP